MKYNAASICKQLGKALCYYALFLGIQVITGFLFSLAIGFIIGFQTTIQGKPMPSNAELSEQLLQMVSESTGLLVLLYTIPTLLFLWLFFLIRHKKLRLETGMLPFRKSLIPYILIFAIGITAFLNTALNLLPESWLEAYGEFAEPLGQGPFFMTLIATGICAPLLEEIIFRGLILSRLKKAMPLWVAILISSLLFGIAHGQILWISYTFCLGILFCVIAERTGSILSTMLVHAVLNGLGTCLSYSGYIFTPVVFWITLALGVLLSVLGMWLLIQKTRKEPVAA